MSQENSGFGGYDFKPEDTGAQANFEKVVNLPGRRANPRRLQIWRTLRSNRTLFDVCLRASDREVLCNAHLLAEESAFFLAEFAKPEFGGSHNVLSVVKDACCQYMKGCLGKDTAVATLLVAAKFSCTDVCARAQSYIAGIFHTMRPDALKDCPRPVFWALISKNNLSVYSELQVLTAITVWCGHNGREAFLGLLPAVRLDQLGPGAPGCAGPGACRPGHSQLPRQPPPQTPVGPQWTLIIPVSRMPREKVAKAPPRRVGYQYPTYYPPFNLRNAHFGMGHPFSHWGGYTPEDWPYWPQERAWDDPRNLVYRPHQHQARSQNLSLTVEVDTPEGRPDDNLALLASA
ncbi:hypothetical protein COCOBI_07-2380 [Coccomyxa sp. Obi]|nr:hypothetical protein COCOBI_07-2380 [Coccomyxa sp. Obi]